MNRKADIPTALLASSSLFFVGISLFAMAIYANNAISQSQDLSRISEQLEFSQEYLEKKVELSLKQAISHPSELKSTFSNEVLITSFIIPGTENFFGRVQRKEFELRESMQNYKKIYQFKMENLVLISQNKYNKIERTSDLCMIFDSQGNFLENC
jgi:hypothetical protein